MKRLLVLAVVAAGCWASWGQAQQPTPTPIVQVPALLTTTTPHRAGVKAYFNSVVTTSKMRSLHALLAYTGTATGTGAEPPASARFFVDTRNAPVDGTPHSFIRLEEGYAYVRLNPMVENELGAVSERGCFTGGESLAATEYLLRRGLLELQEWRDKGSPLDKDAPPLVRMAARVSQGEDPLPPGDTDPIQDEVAGAFAYIWWPIVVTHTIVAGANGTDVLARSVKAPDAEGEWDVWVFLVEGPSTLVQYIGMDGKKEQAFIGKAGQYLRFRVRTVDGEERAKLVLDNGMPDQTESARTPAAGSDLAVFRDKAQADFASLTW